MTTIDRTDAPTAVFEQRLAEVEGLPEAPESFDPIVAIRRVEELAREPERLARFFHEAYERLAPIYGYETRKASAVPWDDVPENNRLLMTAVCAEVGQLLRAALRPAADSCEGALR